MSTCYNYIMFSYISQYQMPYKASKFNKKSKKLTKNDINVVEL